MTEFLFNYLFLPAAVFFGLAAAAAGFAQKARTRLSKMSWWGLVAFVATHLIMETWRLAGFVMPWDPLEAKVRAFAISFLVMIAFYAWIFKINWLALIAVGIVISIPAFVFSIGNPFPIRLAWFGLSLFAILLSGLIFVETSREDIIARLTWSMVVVSDGITVVEQLDCNILNLPFRAFSGESACSEIWAVPYLSYYLYAINLVPLIWIHWKSWRSQG